MTTGFAYRWRHLEPLGDPARLAAPELRDFERLWQKQKARLHDSGAYDRFWERLARSWSIETGIIERVYDLSPGATLLLVEQGFLPDLIQHSDSDTKPNRLVEILSDHRAGLGLVMDLIAGKRQLTPGWIKELHALLCRHQEFVEAVEQGPLRRLLRVPFERGAYKRLPNSPTLPDGRVHEYCPPEHVDSEVEQLLSFHAAIPRELPEVRSAYLHHGFTQIHPFQDGNGRVARALASIDFIRVGLFPLVVDRSERDSRYFPALRSADSGDLGPLVRMFVECQQRAIFEAISAAEDVLAEARGIGGAIEAARLKVEARQQADVEKRRIMSERMAELARSACEAFQRIADQISSSVPGIAARTELSKSTNAHYWTRQIVDMARARRYWADTRETRCWARLQLEDGGITDLVVVLHFVGNPSPGTCTSGAFLMHRDRATDGMDTAQFTLLPQEPLPLIEEEPPERQRDRFLKWLDESVLIGLAEWRKRL